MTSLSNTGGLETVIDEDDWRADAVWMSHLQREVIRIRSPFSYRNLHWPGSGLLGEQTVDIAVLDTFWLHMPDLSRGHNTRYGVVGVTRDVYGSPLGGVTVKLFRTSDDVKVDQIVSDRNGNFVVSTPYYPDAHYMVQYKAGSPDVFGSSVNTLIGA